MIIQCKEMSCSFCEMFRWSHIIPRFIILRGSCLVYIKDFRGTSNLVASLHTGSSFGELAFVDIRSRRAATVVSNDETLVLVVEQSSKEYVTDVRSTILFERQKKYSFLKSMVHLNAFTKNGVKSSSSENYKQADRDFRELAKFAFSKRLCAGDVVFQQGSACGSVFVIVNGFADVVVTLQGSQISQPIDAPFVQFHTDHGALIPSVNITSDQPIVASKSFLTQSHKYKHSNSFHSKFISDIIDDSSIEMGAGGELVTSGNSSIDEKVVFVGEQSNVKSRFDNEIKYIPRPPIFPKREVCFSRVRNFEHNSRSRFISKSFRLKTALSGHVIGDFSFRSIMPVVFSDFLIHF
jgi:CRP-like cAMP-binding protein